ncbi:MAG: hypothetical protein BJ554DRAFT_3164 [Olpidium bornovanus]|uniref:Uncharacterized protein n=1 Tax=Olpidium bornovanus TaxID=278681 RepID=A0A8H7ZPM4_9FUNG|nr:MAG: hypothetical protein BJ554DRAFT_3164 [Olpidium bornovanus]
MAAVKQQADHAGSAAEGGRDARAAFSAHLEQRADAGGSRGAAGSEYEVYDSSAKAGGKLSKMADGACKGRGARARGGPFGRAGNVPARGGERR